MHCLLKALKERTVVDEIKLKWSRMYHKVYRAIPRPLVERKGPIKKL